MNIEKLIDELWEDIADREGIPDFNKFDKDVRNEIRKDWESIIRKNMT